MRPSASIRSGIPEAIARTSGVTSSPVVPSPRVIARASRPPSYTTASESPSSFGITTTGWPGKRAKNSATCSGVFDFWSESIGRLWRTGACSTAVAPTCSSGFGSGVSSGCSASSARSSSSSAS